MNINQHLRGAASTVLAALLSLPGLAACAADDPADASPTTVPATSATSASASVEQTSGEAPLSYVAFGASWPYGGHCGLCMTFVSYYATFVEDETGLSVTFDNRTTNGGGTKEFLETLQHEEAARVSVAQADIVMINGAINDLDETHALERYVAGTCGGGNNTRCLKAMGRHWRLGFEAIMDEVDELTDGRPVAVRLVGEQNVFLSDPSIITDYGLPEDFAREGGELLTRLMADAMARVAKRHHDEFVDVWRIFNGPDHDQVWDENTDEAHQAVARAILQTGLEPLDVH